MICYYCGNEIDGDICGKCKKQQSKMQGGDGFFNILRELNAPILFDTTKEEIPNNVTVVANDNIIKKDSVINEIVNVNEIDFESDIKNETVSEEIVREYNLLKKNERRLRWALAIASILALTFLIISIVLVVMIR